MHRERQLRGIRADGPRPIRKHRSGPWRCGQRIVAADFQKCVCVVWRDVAVASGAQIERTGQHIIERARDGERQIATGVKRLHSNGVWSGNEVADCGGPLVCPGGVLIIVSAGSILQPILDQSNGQIVAGGASYRGR